MATIQASIQLKDGMSSTLRAIDKSISNVTSKLDRLQGSLNTALNSASVTKANSQIAQTATQLNRVEQEAQQAATAQQQLTNNTSESASLVQRLEAGFQKVVSAIGLVSKQLGGMSMDMQEMVTHTSKISTNTQKIQTGQQQLTNTVKQGNNAMQRTASSIQRASINQIRLTSSFRRGVMEALRLKMQTAAIAPAINKNTVAQQRFNNTMKNGSGGAAALIGKLKAIGGAYIGIQGVKATLGLADSLTNTTARLNLMNDGLQTTAQLEDKIYQAAMRSRGGFLEMADSVAKLGLRAGNAFKNNDEIIAFSETLNKMFVVAGTESQEAASAMLQLTQALGSGVLQGEEFKAVFEAAPNVLHAVADSLGKPVGELKELASEGKLSAKVVKDAVLKATDKVNEQFKSMPYTWAQVWTTIKNYTIKATRPILQAISNITRNERFIAFANEMGNILSRVAGFIKNVFTVLAPVFAWIFDTIAKIYNFIKDNWSLLAPIIGTVAAAFIALKTPLMALWVWTKLVTIATWAWSAAQAVLDVLMSLNPVGLVCLAIIVLIGLIYLTVAAINKWCDTTYSATGFICGCIMLIYAYAWDCVAGIWNYFATLIEFLVNVWQHPEYAARKMFANLVNLALDGFIAMIDGCDEFCKNFTEAIVGAINTALKAWNGFVEALSWAGLDGVLGVEKADMVSNNYSSGANALKAVKSKVNNWVGEAPKDYWTAPRMEYKGVMDNYMKGYNWGADKATQVENFFSGKNFKMLTGDDLRSALENGLDKFGNPIGTDDKLNDIGKALSGKLDDNPALKDIAAGVGDLNDTTGKISDNLDASSDDLSFMRDLAERRAINRYYYTDMNVTQNNNNHIRNGVDADGVIEKLRRGIFETLSGGAEGAHI